jgi:hypothetical protein
MRFFEVKDDLCVSALMRGLLASEWGYLLASDEGIMSDGRGVVCRVSVEYCRVIGLVIVSGGGGGVYERMTLPK